MELNVLQLLNLARNVIPVPNFYKYIFRYMNLHVLITNNAHALLTAHWRMRVPSIRSSLFYARALPIGKTRIHGARVPTNI